MLPQNVSRKELHSSWDAKAQKIKQPHQKASCTQGSNKQTAWSTDSPRSCLKRQRISVTEKLVLSCLWNATLRVPRRWTFTSPIAQQVHSWGSSPKKLLYVCNNRRYLEYTLLNSKSLEINQASYMEEPTNKLRYLIFIATITGGSEQGPENVWPCFCTVCRLLHF